MVKAVKEAPKGKKAAKATKTAKAPKSDKAPGEYGMDRSHDLPWCDKKVALFKVLKKHGEGTATELANASGGSLSSRDVRHYAYHAKAAGLVAVNQYEKDEKTGKGGAHQYYFSLTAAGKKLDPDKEFKKQKAE